MNQPLEQDLERVLYRAAEIRTRVRQLGSEISRVYRDNSEVTIIAVINGALMFVADLMREIRRPVTLDCMRVSSYLDSDSPRQLPEILGELTINLHNRHVLVVDDILDTGQTMQHVLEELRKMGPASLRFAVLLAKDGRRQVRLKPDFIGFRIPDDFVVGYGLDFAERYRNLRCIGVLKPECQNPPVWK